jgi:hypothetical protein
MDSMLISGISGVTVMDSSKTVFFFFNYISPFFFLDFRIIIAVFQNNKKNDVFSIPLEL